MSPLEFIIHARARIRLSRKKSLYLKEVVLLVFVVALLLRSNLLAATSLKKLKACKQAQKARLLFLLSAGISRKRRRSRFCHRETILLMLRRQDLRLIYDLILSVCPSLLSERMSQSLRVYMYRSSLVNRIHLSKRSRHVEDTCGYTS